MIPTGGDTLVDTVTVGLDDLRPVGRSAHAGSTMLMVVVVGDTAHGLLLMDKNLVPINAQLKAGTFLNYYALRAALPLWPLAPGWRTGVSELEIGGERPVVRALRLAVEGEETLTVPAGTFDCWVLTLQGSGVNERYWVAKSGHTLVRSVEPLNAAFTLELDLQSQ